MKEIQKCNLLRARIKTYVAQQGVTQKSFAEKIKVTEKQLQRFMSGTSLTGSEVYTRSMAFLKTKLPAAAVSVEILLQNTHNNKYEFKSKTDDFVLRV